MTYDFKNMKLIAVTNPSHEYEVTGTPYVVGSYPSDTRWHIYDTEAGANLGVGPNDTSGEGILQGNREYFATPLTAFEALFQGLQAWVGRQYPHTSNVYQLEAKAKGSFDITNSDYSVLCKGDIYEGFQYTLYNTVTRVAVGPDYDDAVEALKEFRRMNYYEDEAVIVTELNDTLTTYKRG